MGLEAAIRSCGKSQVLFRELDNLPRTLFGELLFWCWRYYRTNDQEEAPNFVRNMESAMGEHTRRAVVDPVFVCDMLCNRLVRE